MSRSRAAKSTDSTTTLTLPVRLPQQKQHPTSIAHHLTNTIFSQNCDSYELRKLQSCLKKARTSIL